MKWGGGVWVGMRGWAAEERKALWSDWDAVHGRGRFSLPEGRAGLTGQQQRRLVPPGFLLKTRPHSPPQASRSCVSSFSSAATLSITSLSPPFVPFLLHPPVPPAWSLFPAPLLRSFHFLSLPPPSPLCVLAITDTQAGWKAGVCGCDVRVGRLRGHKRPEMHGSDESGWLWKEAEQILNAASGQKGLDWQTDSRLSSLSSSFSWCLFWPPKKAHHLAFPLHLMFYQTH